MSSIWSLLAFLLSYYYQTHTFNKPSPLITPPYPFQIPWPLPSKTCPLINISSFFFLLPNSSKSSDKDMRLLIKILAGAIPGALILFSSILFSCRRRRNLRPANLTSHTNTGVHVASPGQDSFQGAIAKFHAKSNVSNRNSLRFHHLHPIQNQNLHPFSWDANPQLIYDVTKTGWSRFVFASSLPRPPPMWSLCVPCDASCSSQNQSREEFMQSVKIVDNCTRMSLPLPGPNSSFPQEAYFEIKISNLHFHKQSKDGNTADSDRSKLIKDGHTELQSDALVYAVCDGEIKSVPRGSTSVVCLGLTAGGSKSIPGTYPGSIGFQSNGSVCLDGINLVSESSRADWTAVDRVIGCGFSPSKKKVFFTVDSVLVHVIRCNSEVYRSPLYPVLAAANLDVMVLVNLGQSEFKYAPANAHRSANPSLLRSSPSFTYGSMKGYNEDSRELFSMGMIDSPGITNSKSSSKSNSKHSKRSRDQWDDSSLAMELDKESDLFEIALNY